MACTCYEISCVTLYGCVGVFFMFKLSLVLYFLFLFCGLMIQTCPAPLHPVSATADIAFANPDPACRDVVFLAWCRQARPQRLPNPIMMNVYQAAPRSSMQRWCLSCLVQACQTSEARQPNHDEGGSGSTQIQLHNFTECNDVSEVHNSSHGALQDALNQQVY